MAAIEALQKRKTDQFALNALANALAGKGRHALAHRVLASLNMTGDRAIATLIRGARQLDRANTDGAGARWLAGKLEPPQMKKLGMLAYHERADSLLFDVAPNPDGKDSYSDFIWVLRAAALARNPELIDTHGESVKEHFAGKGYSYYHQIGRYLMDLATLDDILALADSPDVSTEVAYYAGLRAQAEGRMRDASDWFRITAELGQTHEGEYHWAVVSLKSWTDGGKYLEQ